MYKGSEKHSGTMQNLCEVLFSYGCTSKHKASKGSEIVKCEGPFEQIVIGSERVEIKVGIGRERTGSTESVGSAASTYKQSNIYTKIYWLIRTMKEMRDEVACKNKIEMMIKQIIRKELQVFKQELEDVKRSIREKTTEITGSQMKSYSEAAKDKKKEIILIVKPRTE